MECNEISTSSRTTLNVPEQIDRLVVSLAALYERLLSGY
jgi:hypothetical protein